MDIFDDDNEVEIVSRPSTSASAASFASSSSGQPLLFPENDEDKLNNSLDVHGQEKEVPVQQEVDVDDIFDSVVADDLNFDFAPLSRNREIDYDRLEREAHKKAKAKVPRHEILSSSPPAPDFGNEASKNKKGKGKDDGEKERRKPMRLDEARLVGPTGFPQLIEDTKHFQIKGKGHEATDLNRLLQIYQYWTHRLYPKTQFKDTVDRVEKLCHSKLMHNKLSMWRDEAHGKPHPTTEDEDDGLATNTNLEGTATRRMSSLAPESDAAAYASSSPSPPTRPPSSAAPSNAGDEFDDKDMEAIWKEMEMEQTVMTHNTVSRGDGDLMDVDDDIEGWLALEEATDSRSLTSTTASTELSPVTTIISSQNAHDNNVAVAVDIENDEEMWEISREIGTEDARKQAAAHSTTPSRKISTTEQEFDDMYC
ncbi:replication fork protection component Swi3-domain-containing protein [Lentinula aciculospora]|uniref:Chromosome segregation in meiosis protein n=1 Tax=Lentinula aciculospora TaxID=153920 RepID=A0A9W9ARI9_9AGAR|nr:replication fork protection component Swi3-domain-containing protein [Lentinula aciculospora]